MPRRPTFGERFEQFSLRHQRVAVLHEIGKDVEHLWLQVDDLVASTQHVTIGVEDEPRERAPHGTIVAASLTTVPGGSRSGACQGRR